MTPQSIVQRLLEDDEDPSSFVDGLIRDMDATNLTNISSAFKQLWHLGYRPTPPWSQSDVHGDVIALKEVRVSFDHRTHVICYEPSTQYDFMVIIRTLSGDELEYFRGGVFELPMTLGQFSEAVNGIEKCLEEDDAFSAERAMRRVFASARH